MLARAAGIVGDLGAAVVAVMRAWPGDSADQMVDLTVGEELGRVVPRHQRNPRRFHLRPVTFHHACRVGAGLRPVGVHPVEVEGAVTVRRQPARRTRHLRLSRGTGGSHRSVQ